MPAIEILKNVPMPKRVGSTNGKYPWRAMDVGDSFLFPRDVKNPHSAARIAGVRLGRLFVVRKMEDGSYGCWRVEAPKVTKPNSLREQLSASLAMEGVS